MKYILKNDYTKRIVWYDEGMAQLMSGEKDEHVNKERFKRFYLRVQGSYGRLFGHKAIWQ